MSAPWLIAVFVAVFVVIAVTIVRFRLNPVLVLLLGAIALGLATGVSFEDVTAGLSSGFGALMAEVGLLITLGVIMGFLMSAYGAVQRIVDGIVSILGRRGSPYAFSVTLATVTPAIYFDVLLVLVAPIARRVADRSDRPAAFLAGPVALGLAAGNALVVPGAAMLAYVGALSLSPSEMLLPGFAVAVPAVVATTYLYGRLVAWRGFWDSDLDEDPAAVSDEPIEDPDPKTPRPGLLSALSPVLTVLILILVEIIGSRGGVESAFLEFVGSPVIAMLAGVLVALAQVTARQDIHAQAQAVDKALETVGTILAVTAVAGSLSVIVAETGMQEVLADLFAIGSALPLLLVWVVAAVLRAAIGGQTVAGLTAIGIVAPLVADLDLSPALVVLAAGAGGCFAGQFTDNAFWMLRSLFGLSTRGTLKTYTLAQSMLSVITLLFVLAADLVV